ncbi:hypothetical protein Tco_0686826 [Tanacetum coccineum]
MYKEYLAEFWYSAKALENSKVFFSTPTGGIYGEVGVNTFRNAIGAYYLPHSSEYVAPSSIDIVRPWFETIRYEEVVPAKGTLKKSLLPPRWRLLMAQIIQCLGGKTGGFDQITNKDVIILYSLANGDQHCGTLVFIPTRTNPPPSITQLAAILCSLMILGSLKKSNKRSFEYLKPRGQDTRRTSGKLPRKLTFPQFLLLEAQTQVIEQYTAQSGMDSKMAKLVIFHIVVIRTMSSPNRSTFDIEDAFSSMNILNYTSVSSDYFSASSESSSFNSLKNPKENMIPLVFSSFYNNPCLKDVQAFYAKELPISPPDPITLPAILTPSPVLPPSLLFDPRYFFVPEELLPPKKRIRSPSSSSTTLFNSSRNQTCDLVSPSFSVYTPTPPQVFEIGKCSDKMYLKHHEKQVEDILNYLDELSLHRIEKMEEGRINGNELKTELKRIRTQIIKLQKKWVGKKDKISFAHYIISNLEQIIKEIQACTDISNISRKPSKTGKHGHGKRKSTREAKDSKPKPEKVKPQSKKVKP